MARFEKGKSGNPGGRPKDSALIAEAARLYGQEAIDTLVKLMRIKSNPKVSALAARELLDRGYGKAHQSHEVHSFKHTATEMTEEALEHIASGGSAGDSATPPSTH